MQRSKAIVIQGVGIGTLLEEVSYFLKIHPLKERDERIVKRRSAIPVNPGSWFALWVFAAHYVALVEL